MFTTDQNKTMLKTTLQTIANGLLTTNGSLTTKELKDQVHKLGANVHFPNGEFTQKMASEFLNEFYNENIWDLNREPQYLGNIGYWVYSKKQDDITLATQAQASTKPKVFELSDGAVVCYNRNNPMEYVQANDRRTARTAVAKQYNVKNRDHINTCSATYFKKVFIDRIQKQRGA